MNCTLGREERTITARDFPKYNSIMQEAARAYLPELPSLHSNPIFFRCHVHLTLALNCQDRHRTHIKTTIPHCHRLDCPSRMAMHRLGLMEVARIRGENLESCRQIPGSSPGNPNATSLAILSLIHAYERLNSKFDLDNNRPRVLWIRFSCISALDLCTRRTRHPTPFSERRWLARSSLIIWTCSGNWICRLSACSVL